ncbi:MAG: hypothetical protein U5K69_01395 [Balneolaceae bacterium]|nr:hypothetical protein [Balneolaceae bacterium]
MSSSNYSHTMQELVLNWKLRLVVSALFSIMGFAVLIATLSGYFMPNFEVIDQTIVGVAVFIIVIPVYLIIADLPKINEQTIVDLLNESVPRLDYNAQLILKNKDELPEQKVKYRRQVEDFFEDKKVYRFLPNRPIHQAVIILVTSLLLTAGVYFLL